MEIFVWFRCDPDVEMARQDNAFYTYNEAKISGLAAIMSGVAMTINHLGTISPARNTLLAKAQNIRMRNARPFLCEPDVWPDTFEGTIDGKRAVAAVNTGDTVRILSMEELGLPQNCIDLLDEKKIPGELCLAPHDAVLLIAE
ncbi:MAG: hypothetical protein J6W00_02735 [Lentisphaeria bacterium]|nr:hypothetical protein [Lentisphaeria bacterium]